MKKYSFFLSIMLLLVACEGKNNPFSPDYGKKSPTVDEVLITDVTATSATLSSSILNYGDYSAIGRGFSVGTGSNPYETGSGYAAENLYGNDFSVTVTDLQPNTTYYVGPYVQVEAEKYFVYNGRIVAFTTKPQGDYSQAIVSSDNQLVEIHLRGCYRSGSRVTIEATILNKGIMPYTNYMIYENNYGYQIANQVYYSMVIDDAFTDYGSNAVTKYLNNESSNSRLYTQLPVGATKILTVKIEGVPAKATVIDLYLATVFQNAEEFAYLSFKNVPIY